MTARRRWRTAALAAALVAAAAGAAAAQEGAEAAGATGGTAPPLAAALLHPEAVIGPAAAELHGEALRREVVAAIEQARDWLVANQNPDGSFGTHHTARSWEIMASVPGSLDAFRYATSALCVMALDQCARPDAKSAAAAGRGLDWLLANHQVKRQNGMEFYNTWALGYGLQAIGEYGLRHGDDARLPEMKAVCRKLLDRLPSYQILDGGFSYYDFSLQSFPPSESEMSFTTATVLIGVARAEALGEKAPDGLVARATERLREGQIPLGSFVYGRYLDKVPRMGINEPKGSACRTPGNLYALELFGTKPKVAVSWHEAVDNLVRKYVGFQQIAVRRPVPHESWYSISGYFYLYGFYYAALVLDEKLADGERAELWPWLARGVLYCRQRDGSFWDYPLYNFHYHYGTAYSLSALSRAPKGWLDTPLVEPTAASAAAAGS